jgi:VanZ family protein
MMRGLRWLLTTGWTILTLYLMLSPGGESTVIERLSRLAGGTDFTDAVGHFALFGILAILWYVSLTEVVSLQRAARVAGLVALLLGVGTEAGQSVIHARGASLFDLVTDGLGIWIALGLVRRRSRVRARTEAG